MAHKASSEERNLIYADKEDFGINAYTKRCCTPTADTHTPGRKYVFITATYNAYDATDVPIDGYDCGHWWHSESEWCEEAPWAFNSDFCPGFQFWWGADLWLEIFEWKRVSSGT